MTCVYVLCGHYVNDNVLGLYKQLQDDFQANNVYMLLDTTNGEPQQPIANLLSFSSRKARKIDPFFDEFNLPGMGYRFESKMIYADREIRRHRDFQYIWFIEYDVYCKGSFAKALKPYANYHCDLLAKGGDDRYAIRTFCTHPLWCWWGDLFGEIAMTPYVNRTGSFLPVMRVSRQLIQLLTDNLGRSTGYCEVYIPTLCVTSGLTYKTLMPPVFGKFRYRPVMTLDEVEQIAEQDKLYHPVKI
jgi:hypothetical protein